MTEQVETTKIKKANKSIASKLSFRIVAMIAVTAIAVGAFGLFNYYINIVNVSSEKALFLAEAMAAGIDGDSMQNALKTGEKDEQWENVKERADTTIVNTHARFIYIMGSEIVDGSLVYYLEGQGTESDQNNPFLGLEPADVFAVEIFTTIDEGISTRTSSVYQSGEYGYFLSGHSPIKNSKGEVVGVVGVDVVMDGTINTVLKFGIMTLIIVIVSTVIFAILSVVYIRRSVKNPIVAVTRAAEKLAIGDTNVELAFDSEDEIGVLATAFDTMAKSTNEQIDVFKKISEGNLSVNVVPRSEKDELGFAIGNTLSNIQMMVELFNRSSESLSESAKAINEDSVLFAKDAANENIAVEGIADSISHITEKAQENSDKASQAQTLIGEMEVKAKQGNAQIELVEATVSEIQKSFDEINTIVDNIEGIAFQTNILALNASVEAARAGQLGKGFGVVADEVGLLASKSSESVKNTGVIIEKARSSVQRGVKVAKETAEVFDELSAKIRQGGELMNSIASASAMQGNEIVNINEDIESVSNMIKRTAKAAEGSTKISEKLSDDAKQLSVILEHYDTNSYSD